MKPDAADRVRREQLGLRGLQTLLLGCRRIRPSAQWSWSYREESRGSQGRGRQQLWQQRQLCWQVQVQGKWWSE